MTQVLSSSPERTLLRFSLGDFEIGEQAYRGRRVSVLKAAGAGRLKVRDAPSLPVFRSDVIVASDGIPELTISNVAVEEIACAPPVPSAGFVSRASDAVRPVPRFGGEYDREGLFPREEAALGCPYRIRETRGVGITIQPFQYDCRRGVLRVCRQLDLEVRTGGNGTAQRFSPVPGGGEFRDAAAVRFANFATAAQQDQEATGREGGRAPGDSPESLLIVAPDAWVDAIADFADWKRRRGLSVAIARYPTDTGSGATALDAFIEAKYNTDGTSYVILMGDHADVPVYAMSPHPSDTLYTLVSGDDKYHDLFISRVSVSDTEGLAYQLGKIVDYERAPAAGGEWYTRATMVGSAEGATNSAFGLDDWELLDQERADLLAGGYTVVDQIYDPGATSAEVVSVWNAGRALLYYLGHGTETSWNTTGFDRGDAGTLANGTALPLVINGNCKNGNFTRSNGDCLAEAMMKSGTVSAPAGTLAVISSTTNMDWDPPIVMLRHITDLVVAGGFESAGGIAVFGVQAAMDYCYSTEDEGVAAAETIMEQTHLFGDCTLGFRTRVPDALNVTHGDVAAMGQPFVVQVASGRGPVEDATVCLYGQQGTQVVGHTDANGEATLQVGIALSEMALALTVYDRNAVPYETDVLVGEGLLVIYSPGELPAAFVDEHFSFAHLAAGGTEPYSWSITDGGAEWLSLDEQTGVASGTPDATGTVTYTVQVTDAEDVVVTQNVTLTVGVPVAITAAALSDGVVGAVYNGQIEASGTFAPFAFVSAVGAPPPGLALSPSGVVSGTPTRSGVYAFTVEATDAAGRTDQREYSLSVSPSATFTIGTPSFLPSGSRLHSYSYTLAANGGSGGGYVWSLTGGALPPGLSLSPDGVVQGTLIEAGAFSFEVRVADDWAPPHVALKQFDLFVNSPVYLTSTVLPGAVLDVPYTEAVPVAGTYTPFTFSHSTQAAAYDNHVQPSTFYESGTEQPWHTDESEWDLDLGFAFPFYDAEYTTCRVGDNGYIVFGDNPPDPYWDADVSNFSQRIMIAPFWTDMMVTTEFPDTGIFISRQPDRVRIRWSGRDYHDDTDVINMSATLYANGRIEFHYGNIATTNRVIVGICNGSAEERELLYSHSWNETTPDPVIGWSLREDVVLLRPQSLPGWLTLASDGELTGTPTATGVYAFTVSVEDAAGNVAVGDVAVTVADASDPDTNGDDDVDNAEILAYVELWAAGQVAESALTTAIGRWRAGGGVGRQSTSGAATRASSVPIASGEQDVYVTEVSVVGEGELQELIDRGLDIGSVCGDVATVYVTATELDSLVREGFSVNITGLQSPEVTRGVRGPPTGYHDYTALSSALAGYASAYPDICRVVSIGQSVQGREIWAVEITDNPDLQEDEPECRFISTIHGDEPVGTEMCLELTSYLLTNYGGTHADGTRATGLVDSTEIWLVPCMNPDGLEAGTRRNANGVDLNRAFPDGVLTELGTLFLEGTLTTTGLEPEVAAIMRWSASRSFVLSAGLHTGSLLVAYPYGNNPQGQSVYTATPDDGLHRYLARTYSSNNPSMAALYPDDIINGADWYVVIGEMPDWHYRYLGVLSTTPELSLSKAPSSSLFPGLWDANRESMLAYLESAHMGVRGIVSDTNTDQGLYARVQVVDAGAPVYTDPDVGDYARLLLPGVYSLEFVAPGYWVTVVENVAVVQDQVTRQDVSLTPAPHTIDRALVKSDTGNELSVSLAIDIDATATPNAFVITEALPDGWSYVTASTTDGAGGQLPEPRPDGDTLSWLVWGDDVGDQELNYRIAPDNGELRTVHVQGRFLSVAGQIPVPGSNVWRADGTRPPTLSNWQFMFTTSLTATPEICIGMAWDATDAFDEGIDTLHPDNRSRPVSRVFLESDASGDLVTDLRAPQDQADWLLTVAAGDTACTIGWETAVTPGDRQLCLFEVDSSGNPNGGTFAELAQAGQFDVEAGSERLFKIRYAGDLTSGVGGSAGWSLVALPVDPVNDGVDAFLYALGDVAPLLWGWAGTQYQVAQTVEPLTGYWLFAMSATGAEIHGTSADGAVQLQSGWNLVGVSRPALHACARTPAIFWWNAAQGAYAQTSLESPLVPGRGYWVHVDAPCELTPAQP